MGYANIFQILSVGDIVAMNEKHGILITWDGNDVFQMWSAIDSSEFVENGQMPSLMSSHPMSYSDAKAVAGDRLLQIVQRLETVA